VVSAGSSLGATNSVPFKIWAVFINDGGTPRIGVYNSVSQVSWLSLKPIAATGILTSATEGGAGAADSAQTFYSSAVATAKAYAVLGNATWASGLAAAGTWSSGPSLVQMYVAGVALPGQRVGNLAYAENAANTVSATLTPVDDTIPQSVEGTQILSITLDPTNAAHLVGIEFEAQVSAAAIDHVVAALFVNAGASAVKAEIITAPGANYRMKSALRKKLLPGATSTQTYAIRIGAGATSVCINGQPGSRLLGGSSAATLEAEEIAT
jgi:hypothetical protein